MNKALEWRNGVNATAVRETADDIVDEAGHETGPEIGHEIGREGIDPEIRSPEYIAAAMPDVWVYDGMAYDLTKFVKEHSGGEFFIGRMKNRDITTHGKHHARRSCAATPDA